MTMHSKTKAAVVALVQKDSFLKGLSQENTWFGDYL